MITGNKLVCTKDHRIMTKNGWIEAKGEKFYIGKDFITNKKH